MGATSTPPPPSLTVAIATCGRPAGLRDTLASIAAQRGLEAIGLSLRVAVVDNHERGDACEHVEAMRPEFPWPIECQHEPRAGISFARNRLVRMARGSEFIAFIDDDEWASPIWIRELMKAARASDATAVLGPVLIRLAPDAAPWMAPLYERPRHPDGAAATVSDFRTSNVLLRMDALRDIEGPFDPAFALIGGSDTVLGMMLEARGATFAWADQATVTEDIPASRVTPSWYLKRRFRSGRVYAKALHRRHDALTAAALTLRRAMGSIGVGTLNMAQSVPRSRLEQLEALGLFVYGTGCALAHLPGLPAEYAGRAQQPFSRKRPLRAAPRDAG